jgi:hypothetical protein
MKYAKMVSEVAWISSIRVTAPTPTADACLSATLDELLILGAESESLEPVAPHGVQVLTELSQALPPGTVETSSAVATLHQEARVSKHAQMLTDGRACHREVSGDLA